LAVFAFSRPILRPACSASKVKVRAIVKVLSPLNSLALEAFRFFL